MEQPSESTGDIWITSVRGECLLKSPKGARIIVKHSCELSFRRKQEALVGKLLLGPLQMALSSPDSGVDLFLGSTFLSQCITKIIERELYERNPGEPSVVRISKQWAEQRAGLVTKAVTLQPVIGLLSTSTC